MVNLQALNIIMTPVILSCLVERSTTEYPDDEFGVQYYQKLILNFYEMIY